jgi:hypothetical protein
MNANERVYALNFAAFTKEYFSSFPGPADKYDKVQSLIFSTTCNVHAVSTTSKFWTMGGMTPGSSESASVKLFLDQIDAPKKFSETIKIIDDCKDTKNLICNSRC